MIYKIFSDLHDNSEGLNAIPIDKDFGYICLGDIVQGNEYGAKRTIDKLLRMKEDGGSFICIYGKHDRGVVDENGPDGASYWLRLRERVSDKDERRLFKKFYNDAHRLRKKLEGTYYFDFLSNLKKTETIHDDGKVIQLVHDKFEVSEHDRNMFPLSPGFRIVSKEAANTQFGSPEFSGNILLVGHSHVPLAYRRIGWRIQERIFQKNLQKKDSINLCDDGSRYILNPGSLSGLRRYDNRPPTLSFDKHMKTYGVMDIEGKTFEVVFV